MPRKRGLHPAADDFKSANSKLTNGDAFLWDSYWHGWDRCGAPTTVEDSRFARNIVITGTTFLPGSYAIAAWIDILTTVSYRTFDQLIFARLLVARRTERAQICTEE